MSTTVRISGRDLPACGVVCPQEGWGAPRSEWDRSVGVYGPDGWPEAARLGVYVPCESGLLLFVQAVAGSWWSCYMYAPVCEASWILPNEGGMLLPMAVELLDGELRPLPWAAGPGRGTHGWDGAEEGWLLEHVDRISRKPLELPDGPRARLVPCDAELSDEVPEG